MQRELVKKRKSLLSQQAAAAGVSFTGGAAEARNSRTRVIGRDLTTPLSRPPPGSAKGSCQIPRRVAVAKKGPPVASSASRGGMTRTLSSNTLNKGDAYRSGSRQTNTKGCPNSTMRRSLSCESLGMGNASRVAFTPRMGLSPGPGPSSASRPTGIKITKMPATNDGKTITKIVDLILKSLTEFKYGQLDFKQFRTMGGKDLHKIMIFLLSFLLGPNEGNGKKDDIQFIFDGLNFLSCPAVLSKSQLKTLTTPHTIPYCYTVIAWLCCILGNFEETAFGEDSSNKTSVRTMNFEYCSEEKQVEELSWDILQQMFINHCCGFDVDVEAEKQNFQDKLTQIYGEDESVSLTDLEDQIQEKLQLRESVFAVEDPRAEVLQALSSQEDIIKQSKKRIAELDNSYQKLMDLAAVETELTVLRGELARKKVQLKSLKDSISHQKLTKEEAESLVNQSAVMKKQTDSLQNITADLQRKLNKQEQFLKNNMDRFYQVAGSFSVIEMYNNAAGELNATFPQIEPNPFDVFELKKWITEVNTKVGNLWDYINRDIKKFNEQIRITKSKLSELETECENLQDIFERKSSELSFHMHEQSGKSEQINMEIDSTQKKLLEAEKSRNTLRDELSHAKSVLAETKSIHLEWEAYFQEITDYKEELDTLVESQYLVHTAADNETKRDLLAFVSEARGLVYAPISELADVHSPDESKV